MATTPLHSLRAPAKHPCAADQVANASPLGSGPRLTSSRSRAVSAGRGNANWQVHMLRYTRDENLRMSDMCEKIAQTM